MKTVFATSAILLLGVIQVVLSAFTFTNKPDIVTVVDGVLSFADYKEFEATLQKMKNDDAYLESFESQFPGFISMRQAFDAITEEQQVAISRTKSNKGYEDILTLIPDQGGEIGDFEAVENVNLEFLSRIVNHRGLVQIGPDAYKITYHKTYKTDAANIHVLKGKSIGELDNTKGVEVINNVRGPNMVEVSMTPPDINQFDNLFVSVRNCTISYNNNGQKRIKGTLNNPWLVLYTDINVKTQHQKKVLGVWWVNKAKSVSLSADGTFQENNICIPTCPFSVRKSKKNDGEVIKVIEFCAGLGAAVALCDFDFVTANSTHTVECDDNQIRECSNSVP